MKDLELTPNCLSLGRKVSTNNKLVLMSPLKSTEQSNYK